MATRRLQGILRMQPMREIRSLRLRALPCNPSRGAMVICHSHTALEKPVAMGEFHPVAILLRILHRLDPLLWLRLAMLSEIELVVMHQKICWIICRPTLCRPVMAPRTANMEMQG